SLDLPQIANAGERSREKPEIYPFHGFMLIGSNVASPGWVTPTTVTVSVVGEGSLLEVNQVEAMVVPYIPS
ncbi:MAG: hypothetical protein ACE5H0_13640, partial [Bacteroidota bacterium]